MKKNLAIVLALALVLCATVALAADYVDVPAGSVVIGGHYIQTATQQHIYVVKADAATGTNMACTFQAKGDPTTDSYVIEGVTNAYAHEVVTVTTQKGVCAQCGREMLPEVTTVTKAVPHTLVRGAYKGFDEAEKPYLCHNDVTHLVGYDVYEAVCSVCGVVTEEEVPVYKEHNFQTKNATGVNAKGEPVYHAKGSTCHDCGYTRAYKDLTTAAGKKVEAIIAAYEAAGMTVEFDADQMIAVGIEEGEVAEVEGCGVATITFSNWTPIAKNNTNKVDTDEEAKSAKEKVQYVTTKEKTDAASSVKIERENRANPNHVAERTITATNPKDFDHFTGALTHTDATTKTKNINQDRTYTAAYVTMYVDGAAHRVYFYNRHDKNGWVYAFEADMVEETVKVKGFDSQTGTQVYNNKARAARCGAGQEYATVGAYFIGTELNIIGHAYATEGYDTTTDWIMVGDFEFVSNGRK